MSAPTTKSVTEFMDDPINFFGQSYTQMHSMSRAELEELPEVEEHEKAKRRLR